MSRRIPLLGGAALAAVALAAAPGAAHAQAPQTLTLTEATKGSTFNFVDNAPKSKGRNERMRFSVGDAVVFTNPLLDAQRARVGRLKAICFITKPGGFDKAAASCIGVFALAGGNLYADVPLKFSEATTTGTIVGGTGAYQGLHGTLSSVEHKDGTSTDTITLTP